MERTDFATYLAERAVESELIAQERRERLERLSAFVRERRARGQSARLLFVCTHNSRRSQLAMVWAAAAALSTGVDRVEVFSAGIEATAFHRNAVAALARARLPMSRLDSSANPRYAVRLTTGAPLLKAFSKALGHSSLPRANFAAVMTCSEADAACPVVAGASVRIALPYEDPGAADGTPHQAAAYDACCAEIAREMLWAFTRIAEKTTRTTATR